MLRFRKAQSVEAFGDAIDDLAITQIRALVADLGDGACRADHEVQADRAVQTAVAIDAVPIAARKEWIAGLHYVVDCVRRQHSGGVRVDLQSALVGGRCLALLDGAAPCLLRRRVDQTEDEGPARGARFFQIAKADLADSFTQTTLDARIAERG